MKNSSKSQTSSLDKIRQAIKEADTRRLDPSLDKETLALYEEAAVSLRKAERLLIEKQQNSILSSSKAAATELSLKATEIRKKVRRMNRTVHGFDYFETFIKSVTKILSSIGKLI